MPEERLEFSDQDQIRTLFGDRDRYLRLIRDELGIDVVLRDGVVRIFGDEQHVRRGREVFETLANVLRKTGRVRDVDVWEAVAWAAVSGTLIALAKMFAQRRAANYYLRSTGHLPPGLQKD